jgi:hypothetical protein
MCTGRGRCERKMPKARAISPGSSTGSSTISLKAVIGRVIAHRSVVSCRRPQPRPSDGRSLALEITSIGIESA